MHVKTQTSRKATLPLDAPFLSPDSCDRCAVYSEVRYWLRGSGNKVSGSVAAQNTTTIHDFILLPVILDEWKSNVRKQRVVSVCVLSRESCSWITRSYAEGKMSHRIILEKIGNNPMTPLRRRGVSRPQVLAGVRQHSRDELRWESLCQTVVLTTSFSERHVHFYLTPR